MTPETNTSNLKHGPRLQAMRTTDGNVLYRVSDEPDVIYNSKDDLIAHRGLPSTDTYEVATLTP